MQIDLDLDIETFLADHRVGGTALLPTVMGIDAMARAALQSVSDPAARIAMIRNVVVGQPARLINDVSVAVEVDANPRPQDADTVDCRVAGLTGSGAGPDHFQAVVVVSTVDTPVPRARPWSEVDELPLTADHVYPPYFHGPTFQVIAAAGIHGEGLVARAAENLPPLAWSNGPTVSRPRLLELLLQTCGLWELADSGRMMIPHAIEQISLGDPELVGRDPAGGHGMWAFVRNQGGAFDGEVVDAQGEVLLSLTGYRTVDLGYPPDLRQSEATRSRLRSRVQVLS